ncbi:hypothetical protein K501DRAFT_236469 [Backusella circina FSU 941]|nr:hypothetical protein K501DRAFT_236469 [Backusella circina FSU 941]
MTDDTTLLKQLQALSKSQGTRVELYHEFEIAFNDYLNKKCPPEQYYSICKIVTEGFQDVSLEIQNLEREMPRDDIKNMIRRLQEAEKEKLQRTATIQILTIQAMEGDKDYDETIQENKTRLQSTLDIIQEVWDEIRGELAEASMEG